METLFLFWVTAASGSPSEGLKNYEMFWLGWRKECSPDCLCNVLCRKLSIRWERVTLQFHPDEARSEPWSAYVEKAKQNQMKSKDMRLKEGLKWWEHWKTCQFCILLDLRNKPIIPLSELWFTSLKFLKSRPMGGDKGASIVQGWEA